MTTHATTIRNAVFDLAKTVQGFKTLRKTPMPTYSTADLPSLSVFLLSETGAPDGDENAGEPRFIHDARIGLSVVIQNDDTEAAEIDIDGLLDQIENQVYAKLHDSVIFDGFTGFQRTYSFPRDGETYFLEARLQITIRFRTSWPPTITDAFEDMVVTTDIKADAPTVTTHIDLPQS